MAIKKAKTKGKKKGKKKEKFDTGVLLAGMAVLAALILRGKAEAGEQIWQDLTVSLS